MEKQAKKELMWQCNQCGSRGFRDKWTTLDEVNAHTPKCGNCKSNEPWEAVVVEVKTFF
tara:strand:- start:63 stop:239 length:177 start_codon:yes stop_codon:yes gene_type:complete